MRSSEWPAARQMRVQLWSGPGGAAGVAVLVPLSTGANVKFGVPGWTPDGKRSSGSLAAADNKQL